MVRFVFKSCYNSFYARHEMSDLEDILYGRWVKEMCNLTQQSHLTHLWQQLNSLVSMNMKEEVTFSGISQNVKLHFRNNSKLIELY
jgi:hypothetical protein